MPPLGAIVRIGGAGVLRVVATHVHRDTGGWGFITAYLNDTPMGTLGFRKGPWTPETAESARWWPCNENGVAVEYELFDETRGRS